MAGTAHEQQHQFGETLQWETPRPKRQSFLGRLAAGNATTTTTPTPTTAAATAEKPDHALAIPARKPVPTATSHTTSHATPAAAAPPPAAVEATAAFTKSPAEHASPSATAPETAAAAAAAAAAPSSQPRGFKCRLDAILPPRRTYLNGRLTRRKLILFVILPLLVLFLFILPLAIGLGVSLSKKNSSSNVPLPSDLGSGNTNSGETYKGELTYYATGLGACGIVSASDDAIVSVSHILFDAASTSSNPNANPLCGRKIRITRDRGGGSAGRRRRRGTRSSGDNGVKLQRRSEVVVTVVDRCEGCKAADLDLSLGAFTQLADESEGRVEASWTWV